jgi:hypothetical protein
MQPNAMTMAVTFITTACVWFVGSRCLKLRNGIRWK